MHCHSPHRILAMSGFKWSENSRKRASHHRVRFAGRVSGEFANGTLRMRARIYTRDGKRLLTRCDSGTRSWTAAMLRPIAPGG